MGSWKRTWIGFWNLLKLNDDSCKESPPFEAGLFRIGIPVCHADHFFCIVLWRAGLCKLWRKHVENKHFLPWFSIKSYLVWPRCNAPKNTDDLWKSLQLGKEHLWFSSPVLNLDNRSSTLEMRTTKEYYSDRLKTGAISITKSILNAASWLFATGMGKTNKSMLRNLFSRVLMSSSSHVQCTLASGYPFLWFCRLEFLAMTSGQCLNMQMKVSLVNESWASICHTADSTGRHPR